MGNTGAKFKQLEIKAQDIPVGCVSQRYCSKEYVNFEHTRNLETGAYMVKDTSTSQTSYTIDGINYKNVYGRVENLDFRKAIYDTQDEIVLYLEGRNIENNNMNGQMDVLNANGVLLFSVKRLGEIQFTDIASKEVYTIVLKTDKIYRYFGFYLSKSNSVTSEQICIAKAEKRGAKSFINVAPNVDALMILSMYVTRRKMLSMIYIPNGVGDLEKLEL